MKNFTQKFIGLLALVFAMSSTVNSQEIGDIYQGGIVFQINENGTGLLADLQDLGQMSWYNGMSAAPSATSQGYDDWYLPSLEELELMYNTIGNGGPEGNIGGFSGFSNSWYWSSSEAPSDYDNAWCVDFDDGDSSNAAKYGTARIRVIRSFGEDEEVATQNIPLDLPQGWSMFGYTCPDSVDAMVGFSAISDKIEIVKDEWGLSYLPSWEFNAMGSLQFSEGYQIKMIEEVTDFQFCTTIAGGASQEELDAALESLSDLTEQMEEIELSYSGEDILYISDFVNSLLLDVDSILDLGSLDLNSLTELSENYLTPGLTYLTDNSLVTEEQVALLYDILFDVAAIVANQEDGITQADVDAAVAEAVGEVEASYEGWCESDLDNDGICDVDEVWGCMETEACNWVPEAEFELGTCTYPPEPGYDCDGNFIEYAIGAEHFGGMIFYIDETGEHGLVAAMEDLGQFQWGCSETSLDGADGTSIGTGYQNTLDIVAGCSQTPIAASLALAYVSEEGYSDWYLPSKDELHEIYNTIGPGGPEGNIAGFETVRYWSSSENNYKHAWNVNFDNGSSSWNNKVNTFRVRVIRAF